MAFDPLTWAIGFGLTGIGGQLLDKFGARSFADSLQKAVVNWASGLPSEFRDLHPEALAECLFEADLEELGPKRKKLQEFFEEGTVPPEQTWFDAVAERREEIHTDLGRRGSEFLQG